MQGVVHLLTVNLAHHVEGRISHFTLPLSGSSRTSSSAHLPYRWTPRRYRVGTARYHPVCKMGVCSLYSSHRTEEAVFGRRTSRYTCECAGSKPGASTADCPSGQWERTVNPSAYAYVGSNPTSATPSQPRFSLRESGLTFLCLFRGRVGVGDASAAVAQGPRECFWGCLRGSAGSTWFPQSPRQRPRSVQQWAPAPFLPR